MIDSISTLDEIEAVELMIEKRKRKLILINHGRKMGLSNDYVLTHCSEGLNTYKFRIKILSTGEKFRVLYQIGSYPYITCVQCDGPYTKHLDVVKKILCFRNKERGLLLYDDLIKKSYFN